MTTKHVETMKEARATCPRTGDRYVIRYGFDLDFAARNSQLPHLSVTCAIYDKRGSDIGGGVLSDDVAARLFQDHPLRGLIPFHLCNPVEPVHVGNVVFLAGERDCWGLLKGERRQIRNGKSGVPCWELRVDDGTAHGAPMPTHSYGHEAAERPTETITLRWFPWERIGEGKARELDSARRVAIWPDATDADLSVDADTLRAMLAARMPSVVAKMRAACDAAGIAWPNVETIQRGGAQ